MLLLKARARAPDAFYPALFVFRVSILRTETHRYMSLEGRRGKQMRSLTTPSKPGVWVVLLARRAKPLVVSRDWAGLQTQAMLIALRCLEEGYGGGGGRREPGRRREESLGLFVQQGGTQAGRQEGRRASNAGRKAGGRAMQAGRLAGRLVWTGGMQATASPSRRCCARAPKAWLSPPRWPRRGRRDGSRPWRRGRARAPRATPPPH